MIMVLCGSTYMDMIDYENVNRHKLVPGNMCIATYSVRCRSIINSLLYHKLFIVLFICSKNRHSFICISSMNTNTGIFAVRIINGMKICQNGLDTINNKIYAEENFDFQPTTKLSLF